MVYFFNLEKEKKRDYLVRKKGKYVFFIHNLSGQVSVKIENRGCQVYIFGVFLGKNEDNFELKTVQHHRIGQSLSNLLIKGVFFDKSRFSYQGLIRIEKGADKTFSYQKSQNLVFSPGCFIESKPYLEILANDVYCTHGATISKLDKEQIYYLNCRGLDFEKASQVLVEGFLKEVFLKMEEFLPKSKIDFLYQKVKRKLPKNYD